MNAHRRLCRPASFLALLWLSGCTEGAEPASNTTAIVGGTLSASDPAVVAIGQQPTACGELLVPTCTGTLIAPRVVVSAAHCFRRGPVTPVVFFGTDVADQGDFRSAVEVLLHPDFDDSTNENDIALILLDADAPTAPVPYSTTAITSAAVGENARVVGFGGATPMTQGGQRREGLTRIDSVDSLFFRTVPDPAMTCVGDSGGPLFMTVGAEEVLVGITSSGDFACEEYAENIDVGLYDTFIGDFVAMAATPPPSRSDGPIGAEAVCESQCTEDADCPSTMQCTEAPDGARCTLPGQLAGDLGASCTTDAECSSASCVAVAPGGSCACLTTCLDMELPMPDEGCCSTGAGHPSWPVWWVVVLIGLLFNRRPKFEQSVR